MNPYIYVPLSWSFSKENNMAFRELCEKFIQGLVESKNRKENFKNFISQTDNFLIMNPLKSESDRASFAELYWGFLTATGRMCSLYCSDIEKAFKAAETKQLMINAPDPKIN